MLHIVKLIERRTPRHAGRIIALLSAVLLALLVAGLVLLRLN